MPKKKDLTGNVYTRLKVVREAAGYKIVTWECLCQCGNITFVSTGRLQSGNTKSCGCIKNEKLLERNTTHGLSHLPEYQNWKDMLKRCYNKNNKRYAEYSKKGIIVCDEWVKDFKVFYEYLGSKPDSIQKWSVGRIDNNDIYKPGNVRWKLLDEQARNHSKQKNNTSGTTGIKFRSRVISGRVYESWTGTYSDGFGKKKSKEFSVHKYGYETAKNLALEFRNEGIEKLKLQGIFYAESHGTDFERIYG